MTDVLDTGLQALFADRTLLNRVVTSVQLDQDLSFIDALERVHEATEAAIRNGEPTLRGALNWTRGGDAEYTADAIKVLERRDALVATAERRVPQPVELARDAQGLVLLDQGDGISDDRVADVGAALTDPAEQERRLARARQLDASYRGNEGRALFLNQDRQYLEAGRDWLATMEHQAATQAAQSEARRLADPVARQLDSTIAGSADKRQKLKLMEAQVAELGGDDQVRDKLRSQIVDAAREPVRMLDQMTATAEQLATRSLLDQGSELRTPGRLAEDRKRLDELAKTQTTGELLKTLEAYRADGSLPPASTSPAEPSTPPGVNPESHALHRRVQERMLASSDLTYLDALGQIQRELGSVTYTLDKTVHRLKHECGAWPRTSLYRIGLAVKLAANIASESDAHAYVWDLFSAVSDDTRALDALQLGELDVQAIEGALTAIERDWAAQLHAELERQASMGVTVL